MYYLQFQITYHHIHHYFFFLVHLTRKSNQSRSNKPLFFLMIFFSKPTRFFPATAFIEFWKRRQAVIAWEWDLTNFEEEEQTRPEFEASIKTTRINPVTKKPEPYLPTWNKCYRVTATWSVVLFMVSIVILFWIMHPTTELGAFSKREKSSIIGYKIQKCCNILLQIPK